MARVHQLVYVSAARRGLADEELIAMLVAARRANRRVEITGLLLYSRGGFMQLLEGPGDAVQRTFERIQGDGRHRHVSVLLQRDVSRRAFGDWSMGFRHLDPGQTIPAEGVSGFLERSNATARLPDADLALRMLYGFRDFA